MNIVSRIKFFNKLIPACFMFLFLNGCMPYHTVQAPCNQWASGCGPKIKINQWQC